MYYLFWDLRLKYTTNTTFYSTIEILWAFLDSLGFYLYLGLARARTEPASEYYVRGLRATPILVKSIIVSGEKCQRLNISDIEIPQHQHSIFYLMHQVSRMRILTQYEGIFGHFPVRWEGIRIGIRGTYHCKRIF
jgi:hypothetical protein